MVALRRCDGDQLEVSNETEEQTNEQHVAGPVSDLPTPEALEPCHQQEERPHGCTFALSDEEIDEMLQLSGEFSSCSNLLVLDSSSGVSPATCATMTREGVVVSAEPTFDTFIGTRLIGRNLASYVDNNSDFRAWLAINCHKACDGNRVVQSTIVVRLNALRHRREQSDKDVVSLHALFQGEFLPMDLAEEHDINLQVLEAHRAHPSDSSDSLRQVSALKLEL